MRILIVEPQKQPRIAEIHSKLEEMQAIVGGFIEALYLDDETCLYCNEEGKINGLQGNRRIGDDIIAGTFFICGDDGEGCDCSLTDEQIAKYYKAFEKPEYYTAQDVESSMFFEVSTSGCDYDDVYEDEDEMEV